MVIIGIVTLLTLVEFTNGCCLADIPASEFCNADLVIEGGVYDIQEIFDQDFDSDLPKQLKYTVRVSKVFKAPPGYHKDDTLYFYTRGMGTVCETRLARNKPYLINAKVHNGKLEFAFCSWFEEMSHLTPNQVAYINGGYSCN